MLGELSTETFVETDTSPPLRAQLVFLVLGVRPRTKLAAAAGLQMGKLGVKVNKHTQTSDPDGSRGFCYDLHLAQTQGIGQVKTERMAGRQRLGGRSEDGLLS